MSMTAIIFMSFIPRSLDPESGYKAGGRSTYRLYTHPASILSQPTFSYSAPVILHITMAQPQAQQPKQEHEQEQRQQKEQEAKKPLSAKWTFTWSVETNNQKDNTVIVKITPDERFRGGQQAKFRGHLDVEVSIWVGADDEQRALAGPSIEGQTVVKEGKWIPEGNVFEFMFQGVVVRYDGVWHYTFKMEVDNGPNNVFEVGTAVCEIDLRGWTPKSATRS